MKKYKIIISAVLVLILSNCAVSFSKLDHPENISSNEEIRIWYNAQAGMIPELNSFWKKQGISAKERAKRAFEIRHRARLKARTMMQNKEEVRNLEKRDKEKYGDKNGPSFESLVQKAKDSGLLGDEVYESIIESSSRTDEGYNKINGLSK